MLISAFITHKKAERFSDCQDRFSINRDTKSMALSDGMSQSIFQKYWAEILVNTFTATDNWKPNLASVRKLASQWKERVLAIIQEQKENGHPSAWRAERSIATGYSAGATFLGLRFNGMQWTCEVLGDSCLILVRDNLIQKIITSEDVTAFNNYPDYYDSNPEKEGKGTLWHDNGTLESGDTLLLVSDPFSDFLLKHKDTDKEAYLVDRLLGVNSHQEFEEVVDEWRNDGMHNDDSTLIIIKQGNGDSFEIVKCDEIDKLIEAEEKKEKEEKEKQKSVEPLQASTAVLAADATDATPMQEETLPSEGEPEPTKELSDLLNECFERVLSKLSGLILVPDNKRQLQHAWEEFKKQIFKILKT